MTFVHLFQLLLLFPSAVRGAIVESTDVLLAVHPAAAVQELPAAVKEGLRVTIERQATTKQNFTLKTVLIADVDSEDTLLTVRSSKGFMVSGKIRINPGGDTVENGFIKRSLKGGKEVNAAGFAFTGLQGLAAQSEPSGVQQVELAEPLKFPHFENEKLVLVEPFPEMEEGAPARQATTPPPAPTAVPQPTTIPASAVVATPTPLPTPCPGNCSGHGTCQRNGTCNCTAGWVKEDCSEVPCVTLGHCHGHGECMNGTCVCEEGWGMYANCSLQGDGCPGDCSGHGTCIEGYCNCRKGWAHDDCNLDISTPCPNMCGGHGVCKAGTCYCFPGYEGVDCGKFCPLNCTNRGRCNHDGNCVCRIGFGGEDCAVQCPNRCHGAGECVNGSCVCFDGYGGPACDHRVEPHGLVPVLGLSFIGYTPILLAFVLFVLAFTTFCGISYAWNVFVEGVRGTDAVPLYNYWKWKTEPHKLCITVILPEDVKPGEIVETVTADGRRITYRAPDDAVPGKEHEVIASPRA